MTKREATRTARRKQLAEFIQEALTQGRQELPLVEILPKFTGDATFARLSSLHVFVDHQYVTAPHPGPGGHRPRIIELNSSARRYAEEILDCAVYVEIIPDGTPIGDPIFSAPTTR